VFLFAVVYSVTNEGVVGVDILNWFKMEAAFERGKFQTGDKQIVEITDDHVEYMGQTWKRHPISSGSFHIDNGWHFIWLGTEYRVMAGVNGTEAGVESQAAGGIPGHGLYKRKDNGKEFTVGPVHVIEDSKEFTKHVVAAPNAFLINLGNSNHDSQVFIWTGQNYYTFTYINKSYDQHAKHHL